MAYSFRPRTGATQSGSVWTPLTESKASESEVTASEAMEILASDASQAAVTKAKGTVSADQPSESIELQHGVVSAEDPSLPPNAVINATQNLPLSPNAVNQTTASDLPLAPNTSLPDLSHVYFNADQPVNRSSWHMY